MQIMSIIINDVKWAIKTVDEINEHLYVDDSERYRFGVCDYEDHIIYLLDNNIVIRQTLIHELAHAFIACYGMYAFDTFNHDQMCEFISWHGTHIIDIADRFMDTYIYANENN